MTPDQNAIIEKFVKFAGNPENDEITDGQWCAQNKLDPSWLNKLRTPDVQRRVLEARRTQYSKEFLEIDKALIKKAKAGDTKAAELLWRRHENWTPKQAEDSLKRNPTNKTFAELMKEV